MNKHLTSGLCAGVLLLCLCGGAAAQNKPADFAGTWLLDKAKTPDLPPTLESYTLTVMQDAQYLAVETKMQGQVNLPRGGTPGGGGFPGGGGGGRGGGGGGGGGGGFPGGGGGGGFPGGGGGGDASGGGGGGGGFRMPRATVMAMALRMGTAKAVFTLDGKENVIQIEPQPGVDGRPGQPGGTLIFKCNVKKNGRQLDLQATRKMKTPDGAERSLTGKDRWELSEDGKILLVKRTIETPAGGDEAKFVFNKQ